jgi:hypothetical protein
VKKINEGGAWKFVAMRRNGSRYLSDDRPGTYYLDWWGRRQAPPGVRRRDTESGANSATRKQNEVVGSMLLNGKPGSDPPDSALARRDQPAETARQTPISDARKLFLSHVEVHSPDKPETQRRYRQVMVHFERLFGKRKFIEAVTRADIEEYKINRRQEKSERTGSLITAQTVNFELGTLRTFFYYLINERGLDLDNPCEKFKKLRDAKQKSRTRPLTHSQEELDRLFAHYDDFERAVFGTLLLTGLRKRELYLLTWRDID